MIKTGFPDLEDAAHGLYVTVHYPGFIFVPEADVFGQDETRQYPELDNNVPALIKKHEELRETRTVSGFNTLGYFKNSFEARDLFNSMLRPAGATQGFCISESALPSAILHLYHGGLIWLPGFDGHGCLDVPGKSRVDLKDNIPALYQAAQELVKADYPVGAFDSNGIMKQSPKGKQDLYYHVPFANNDQGLFLLVGPKEQPIKSKAAFCNRLRADVAGQPGQHARFQLPPGDSQGINCYLPRQLTINPGPRGQRWLYSNYPQMIGEGALIQGQSTQLQAVRHLTRWFEVFTSFLNISRPSILPASRQELSNIVNRWISQTLRIVRLRQEDQTSQPPAQQGHMSPRHRAHAYVICLWRNLTGVLVCLRTQLQPQQLPSTLPEHDEL
ncbi:hypothetical protein WJX82_006263 [Trebouxia sp. C0006]